MASTIMASVAQSVRAPVCGTGGRGFKPHHSPQFLFYPLQLKGDGVVHFSHLYEQSVALEANYLLFLEAV